MINSFNLICNFKIAEQDIKYVHINAYLFFHSLKNSVQQNYEILINELDKLYGEDSTNYLNDIFDNRQRIQNFLLNLLNSHKLFMDILKRDYEKSDPKMYSRFKTITSYYYDEDFNYRIFEVLRNYCQHTKPVPLDIFSNSKGVIYIVINKEDLIKDRQSYNKIKRELDSPLPIEFYSIPINWIKIVNYFYDLVLDYFAYKAKLIIKDYLDHLTLDLLSDPKRTDKLQGIKFAQTKDGETLFPIIPNPQVFTTEMTHRLESADFQTRCSRAKSIFDQIKSSKQSDRFWKKLEQESKGAFKGSFDLAFDTLATKYMREWLDEE